MDRAGVTARALWRTGPGDPSVAATLCGRLFRELICCGEDVNVPDGVSRVKLLEALRQSGGRIRGPGGAAELLGLKPTTLASRIKNLKIRKPNA
jgi:hypothetical protein